MVYTGLYACIVQWIIGLSLAIGIFSFLQAFFPSLLTLI